MFLYVLAGKIWKIVHHVNFAKNFLPLILSHGQYSILAPLNSCPVAPTNKIDELNVTLLSNTNLPTIDELNFTLLVDLNSAQYPKYRIYSS